MSWSIGYQGLVLADKASAKALVANNTEPNGYRIPKAFADFMQSHIDMLPEGPCVVESSGHRDNTTGNLSISKTDIHAVHLQAVADLTKPPPA